MIGTVQKWEKRILLACRVSVPGERVFPGYRHLADDRPPWWTDDLLRERESFTRTNGSTGSGGSAPSSRRLRRGKLRERETIVSRERMAVRGLGAAED